MLPPNIESVGAKLKPLVGEAQMVSGKGLLGQTGADVVERDADCKDAGDGEDRVKEHGVPFDLVGLFIMQRVNLATT